MKTQLSLLALICLTATAHAGWTVKVLHPAGATSSQAYCTDGVTVGGQVDGRATIWNINSGAVTYLSAVGVAGEVRAISNGKQGGIQNGNATEWQSTAGSAKSLLPAGFSGSGIYAGYGGQWGGSIFPRYEYQGILRDGAVLWNHGSTAFTDLNIADFRNGSQVLGMSANSQVGVALEMERQRAALWSGPSHSYVDLHPDGFTGESIANASADGVQVGWAYNLGQGFRAALWRGTKESFLDLTPAGAASAQLLATTGKIHVGEFSLGVAPGGAGIWDGPDGKFFNLSSLLDGRYRHGFATSVVQDASKITVSGYTFNNNISGKAVAVTWIYLPVPEPVSGVAVLTGLAMGVVLRCKTSTSSRAR